MCCCRAALWLCSEQTKLRGSESKHYALFGGNTAVTFIAGFSDPFYYNTVTLDNPAYRYLGFSLMKGKLDWLLLRKMQVLETSTGNHDYAASDHKWLSASVKLI